MSIYREDKELLANWPDLDPELVRRAYFFGYDGDTILALKRMNYYQESPAMYGDVETWLQDFGHGHIFRWGNREDGTRSIGKLWQVIPLPDGDILMGFRSAGEIIYPAITYAKLSEIELEWWASDELEERIDLLELPEEWKHRYDKESDNG